MSALTLAASIALSGITYGVTALLIPRVGQNLIQAGLKGKDMLKGSNRGGGGASKPAKSTVKANNGHTPLVVSTGSTLRGPSIGARPESMGLIAGGVYVLVLSLFAPLPFYAHLFQTSTHEEILPMPGQTAFSKSTTGGGDPGLDFPHSSLSTHLVTMLCLVVAIFLGFLDDVFDIRWRFKLPIPFIASVPLLTAYAGSNGSTDIVVPRLLGLRELLGVDQTQGLLKLGPLYYLYMSALAIFCPNSINILAGINGVEVGQSLVIAISIAINDLLYLRIDMANIPFVSSGNKERFIGYGLARGSRELEDRHLFSLYFILPLIGCMLALWRFNKYPSQVFVGDTFCYFAGMAFAVVGILGHFSKTLLLFFIPQIFNFIYSTPQIFGFVPISRHRLPSRNPTLDTLSPSMVLFVEEPKRRTTLILNVMEKFKLVQLTRNSKGVIQSTSNLTLINLVLLWRGSIREEDLTWWIIKIQIGCSILAFGIRYGLSHLFYEASRR